MKKALMAAAALVALPVMAQAQSPSPGVYIGAEGGLNWLLNFNASPNNPAFPPVVSVNPTTGWIADTNFRVNLDGRYYGTSNPTINGAQWTNNNFSVMLGLQLKFGSAPPPPPVQAPPVAPPSF